MSNAVYRLIDLSKWNGKVDFNRVRCAGIDGVIIRTGFGVENPRQIDRRFEEYYSGAKAAGFYVGAYHYSYAKTAAEASAEAEFMLKILKGKSFERLFTAISKSRERFQSLYAQPWSKHSATGWKMQALGQAFTVMILSSWTNLHRICPKDTPCGPQG